jgi:hypothetical protein
LFSMLNNYKRPWVCGVAEFGLYIKYLVFALADLDCKWIICIKIVHILGGIMVL